MNNGTIFVQKEFFEPFCEMLAATGSTELTWNRESKHQPDAKFEWRGSLSWIYEKETGYEIVCPQDLGKMWEQTLNAAFEDGQNEE